MPETELGRQTLVELRNMHDELNGIKIEMAQLNEQIKAVVRTLEHTTNHGERLGKLETEVSNLKSDQRSAATERRWVIGLLVVIGIAIVTLFVQHH